MIWTDSIAADTALTLYDSESNVVAEDDDSGPIGPMGTQLNAEISFEAPSTGTYYLIVYQVDDAQGGSYIVYADIRK